MKASSFLIAPEPVTQEAIELRSKLSPARWEVVAHGAMAKVEVLEGVLRVRKRSGQSWRKSLEQVDPDIGWSRYLHWRRAEIRGAGPKWERLLDRRVPPPVAPISEAVRSATITIRMVAPDISYDQARILLVRQFGESGDISDTSLGRIWREHGMTERPVRQAIPETVEHFHGGGGLALIGAAAWETQAVMKLATAALSAGSVNAKAQVGVAAVVAGAGIAATLITGGVVSGGIGLGVICGCIASSSVLFLDYSAPEIEGRNRDGQFTAEYNKTIRTDVKPGATDARWTSDNTKRFTRDLTTLQTLDYSPITLAGRMLAIGAIPLITELRGMDGVDTIRGDGLKLMGIHSYKAATLDKTLTELALLNVADAMWDEHGRQWREITLSWSEDGTRWLRFAFYIDATADPYWTSRYAASGPISRIGKVRPCLSRICLTGGPGVPLLVETHAGCVQLKEALAPMLERLDKIVGDNEVSKLTIVDAEIASTAILTGLKEARRPFITVLKGNAARHASLEDLTDWVPYRERDRLREGFVTLHGAGAPEGGLRLRVVQMERQGSRHPTFTLFLHDIDQQWMDIKELTNFQAHEVADAYLSRWPNQEQVFRDTRNGAGFERSHGFGGEFVTNYALSIKREKVERVLD